LAALVALEERYAATDPLRRLAAMLTPGAGVGDGVAARLRLSRVQRARLIAMTKTTPELVETVSAQRRHARLYGVGPVGFVDEVLVAWADQVAHGLAQTGAREAAWQALLSLPEVWVAPVLPVRGRDVKALGVAAGPAVGDLLKAVEEWWIAGDFSADRDACLARLGELVGAGDWSA